jgi:hypothetical protein
MPPVVRALSKPIPLHLPPDLDPDALPRFITAVQAQQVAARYCGEISAETIRDRWSLSWRLFNGRFVTDSRDFVTEMLRRFDSAPVRRRGKDDLASANVSAEA